MFNHFSNYSAPGPTLRGSSVREQLSGGVSAAVMVVPSPQPGCNKSLFGRLGIRKPSILSLTSPHGQSAGQQTTAATARTFSLDDLLKPPPRRKATAFNWKCLRLYYTYCLWSCIVSLTVTVTINVRPQCYLLFVQY